MRKQKKGSSEMWWIIGGAILVLVVVILVLIWFRGSGGKAVGSIDQQIAGLQDCDKDQVADLFDKCVCDAGQTGDGCPAAEGMELTLMKSKTITKDCQTICPAGTTNQ